MSYRRPGEGRDPGLNMILRKATTWIPAFAGMTLMGMTMLMASCFLFVSPLHAKVKFGVDVLKQKDFEPLRGARVALITNHTGVDSRGNRTVDLLHNAKNVTLVAILSPEHGFGGVVKHGEKIDHGKDAQTGLPIYSLYGKTTRPTTEMLTGVNTVVFDIQDIGTRFYTYISTMGQALEEAAERGLRFVVLDRPNPIRGDKRGGDILDEKTKRLTGYFPLPTRHGLTVGEIAQWMNERRENKANLTVIKARNWKRSLWFDQLRRKFIPPSPNIPTLTSALLYPEVGCFEATNVSVGRGTTIPFQVFGAPWINEKALVAALRSANLPGVLFEPVTYIPSKDLYKGERCRGVKIRVTNRNTVQPFAIFATAFRHLHEAHPEFKPIWEEVRIVTGSNVLKETVLKKKPLDEALKEIKTRIQKFSQEIQPFLLYP